MSRNPTLSLSSLLRPAATVPALPAEEALNLLPYAACLVERSTGRIRLPNQQMLQLSRLGRNELTQKLLGDLFLDLPLISTPSVGPASRQAVHSTFPGGSLGEAQPMWLTYQAWPQSVELVLVILEKDSAAPATASQIPPPGAHRNPIPLIHALLDANQDYAVDLELALRNMLCATQPILDAECLLLYRADESQPLFTLFTAYGEVNPFPAQFSPGEFGQTHQINLWTPGMRCINHLQRVARSLNLAYLATAPLGGSQSTIGMLVVAGHPQTIVTPISTSSVQNTPLLPSLNTMAGFLTARMQFETQRSRMASAFQAQVARLATATVVIENIAQGVLALTSDLKINHLNPAAERMLGFSGREARGQAVDRIVIATQPLLPALTAARQGSPLQDMGNIHVYRRSGDVFPAHIHVLAVPLPEGYPNTSSTILIMLQDQSEQEHIRLQAQHLEQHAMMGEVTAIFAHEVRNPINNISTGLQLMAYNLSEDDPSQIMLSRLQQDCDRLAELMKGVLTFSRPVEYEMEPLQLGEVLQHLIERLQARLDKNQVRAHLQIEPGCPAVMGNGKALEQVFNNLITNAMQAMGPDGGNLTIKVQHVRQLDSTADATHSAVEVSLADTGPGIPPELQERVFQPFFTTHQNGTGLGLAISKRIITAHKGNLRLASFPGGTIFTIQLPAQDNG